MAQVFPTKANLMATQKSLDLAKLGYELMDRKRNILVREMMQLVDKARTVEENIGAAYQKAYRALKLANITLGVCGNFARSTPVEKSLKLDYKSVMGVEIPCASLDETDLQPYYGMQKTNSYLDEAYIHFNEAKRLTVELAGEHGGGVFHRHAARAFEHLHGDFFAVDFHHTTGAHGAILQMQFDDFLVGGFFYAVQGDKGAVDTV